MSRIFPLFPTNQLCAPLAFVHCLGKSFTATYATVSARYDDRRLWLNFTCFEKFPRPDYRFVLCIGEGETALSMWLSSTQAQLTEGARLVRDGGENLEGVYWGASVSLPLPGQMLLHQGTPVHLSYDRAGEKSSPFEGGVGELAIVLSKKI